MVEVVVVGGVFQHGCGAEPVGCGSFYGACGALEDFSSWLLSYSF
jgi:hypothetical protein